MTFSSSRKRSQSRVNRSIIYLIQFSSVTQLCLTLCDPMDCTTLGLPVHHQLTELCESIESVMPSNHLILCRPLLLLPSIFPSTRVFSNESALCIRWPKYWSFSFSISPSNEYWGMISSVYFITMHQSHQSFWQCHLPQPSPFPK